MAFYTSIEVDFDVFKELTVRRETPETTENDVLRKLLGLDPDVKAIHSSNKQNKLSGEAWVCKGVYFPHGTEFRAEYAGRDYRARVENGALIYEGKTYKSPSSAAGIITESSVNGWKFWECKRPGDKNWTLIDRLRIKAS